MRRMQRTTSMLVVISVAAGLAGCDSGVSPSAMPAVVEGSIVVPGISLTTVSVRIEREGTLEGSVNWNNFFNDIDSGLLQGTCTPRQVQADLAGCRVDDALAFDDTSRRPSRFDTPVTPGDYTLLLFNFGISADTCFYRLEIN